MRGQILMIDDNPLDLKVAGLTLERIGYSCHGFTEPHAALVWLNDYTPQIILLDLQLANGATGFQMIKDFRRSPQTAKTPIVIISGKNDIADVRKAIKLGANDYIVKPLDALVIQEKMLKIGNSGPESFSGVDVPDHFEQAVFIRTPFRLLAVSEFGLRLAASTPIKPGTNMELGGFDQELFGFDQVMARCLSCDSSTEHNGFVVQFTFIGISERHRQTLRKACRYFYVMRRGPEEGTGA